MEEQLKPKFPRENCNWQKCAGKLQISKENFQESIVNKRVVWYNIGVYLQKLATA